LNIGRKSLSAEKRTPNDLKNDYCSVPTHSDKLANSTDLNHVGRQTTSAHVRITSGVIGILIVAAFSRSLWREASELKTFRNGTA